jgi:hypothetical protein
LLPGPELREFIELESFQRQLFVFVDGLCRRLPCRIGRLLRQCQVGAGELPLGTTPLRDGLLGRAIEVGEELVVLLLGERVVLVVSGTERTRGLNRAIPSRSY